MTKAKKTLLKRILGLFLGSCDHDDIYEILAVYIDKKDVTAVYGGQPEVRGYNHSTVKQIYKDLNAMVENL